jgi:peptidoglycan/LPS O-acetylase OafA/YrhL
MSNSQSNDVNLWKGAIFPALVVATFTCICVAIVNGKSGLLAGLLASFTVIIFFSVHLLVARVSRNLDPMLTMTLAMFSYFAKVIFMGVFLLLVTKFTDRSTVDRVSFAICAILITMAWLFGEIRSFMKLRFQMPLPKKEGDK